MNSKSKLCRGLFGLTFSPGSGSGCDTQFLFSDDSLGDYDERPPRHAKTCRNFAAEHRRLQAERLAAFREYGADASRNAAAWWKWKLRPRKRR